MFFETSNGGAYQIIVDQDTLSVYVSWRMNDVIGTDDESQYIFYRYPSMPSTLTNSQGYELWDDKVVRFTHPVASGGECDSNCGAEGCDIFFTDHPISISIDGVKYYYLYDGLGSVTELIDADENVVNFYRYTPFGDALVRQETVYNPYQFTGRQYDAESGLYHYRARAYSADIGRFMQQDPAGMADGANMYAYVGNNPVNGVDPNGMAQYKILKAWGIPYAWKVTFTNLEALDIRATLGVVAAITALIAIFCPDAVCKTVAAIIAGLCTLANQLIKYCTNRAKGFYIQRNFFPVFWWAGCA